MVEGLVENLPDIETSRSSRATAYTAGGAGQWRTVCRGGGGAQGEPRTVGPATDKSFINFSHQSQGQAR